MPMRPGTSGCKGNGTFHIYHCVTVKRLSLMVDGHIANSSVVSVWCLGPRHRHTRSTNNFFLQIFSRHDVNASVGVDD